MTDPEFSTSEVLDGGPPPRRRVSRQLVLGLATAVVVATGVGVAAAAASPSGSPSSSPSASPTDSASEAPSESPSQNPSAVPDKPFGPGRMWMHGFKGMFGGGIHGEFVTPKEDGGYQTIATQFGEVTAVSNDSLTVKSEDGFSRTYTIGSDTRVNAGREGVTAIKTGDQVSVFATVEGSTATAAMVVDMTRPEMGKGWFFHRKEFRGNPNPPSPEATPQSVTPTA